jgi:lysophospholipid acyltransferase
MVNTWSNSIALWKVLNWYGHIVVIGGLVFFYVGGVKWLKGVQKSFGVSPPTTVKEGAGGAANGKVGNSGTATPLTEKNFTLPPELEKLVPPPS